MQNISSEFVSGGEQIAQTDQAEDGHTADTSLGKGDS